MLFLLTKSTKILFLLLKGCKMHQQKNNLTINKVVQQTIIFFPRRKVHRFSSWKICNSCLKQNTFVEMICVKIEIIFEWLITRNSLEYKNGVKIASTICILLNLNLQNRKKIKKNYMVYQHRLVYEKRLSAMFHHNNWKQ